MVRFISYNRYGFFFGLGLLGNDEAGKELVCTRAIERRLDACGRLPRVSSAGHTIFWLFRGRWQGQQLRRRASPSVRSRDHHRLRQRDGQIREYMNFRTRCRSTSLQYPPFASRFSTYSWCWRTTGDGSCISMSPLIRRPSGPRSNSERPFPLSRFLVTCFATATGSSAMSSRKM